MNSVWNAGQHLLANATYLLVPLWLSADVEQRELHTAQDAAVCQAYLLPSPSSRSMSAIIVGYALVARVLVVLDQQVQLGVFLDRHAQIVQRLDGGVARHKVVGARAEG